MRIISYLECPNQIYHLTKLKNSKAALDFDNDGFKEKVSWISGKDALLVIDHNMSSSVDFYDEFSFAKFAGRDATDLDGLVTFDINLDNVIDSKDEVFHKLKIWTDLNSDAVQDYGELVSAADWGLESISLDRNKHFDGVNDSLTLARITVDRRLPNGEKTKLNAYDTLFTGIYDSGIKYITESAGVKIFVSEKNKHFIELLDSYLSLGTFDAVSFEDVNDLDLAGIKGTKHNDKIITSGKHDLVIAGLAGNDEIRSGAGHDFLAGGRGKDKIYGGTGNDLIKGGKGNDELHGGPGQDHLKGGKGKDEIYGNRGNDQIFGGKGNDRLKGGKGNDTLFGQHGNDRLNGGEGNDILYGGKGSDLFVYKTGIDTIIDFSLHNDGIMLGKNSKLTKPQIVELGTDTAFVFDKSNILILNNTSYSQALMINMRRYDEELMSYTDAK